MMWFYDTWASGGGDISMYQYLVLDALLEGIYSHKVYKLKNCGPKTVMHRLDVISWYSFR